MVEGMRAVVYRAEPDNSFLYIGPHTVPSSSDCQLSILVFINRIYFFFNCLDYQEN